jgi:DNA-binding transcriptional LysR family regulator
MVPSSDKLKHLFLIELSVVSIGKRRLELRHLKYFIAVAEEGGFSRAARRLHVVQPTLSMQIRDLEAELGGPLFERGARRTTLTAAGEVFLAEARQVLAQAERARSTTRLALEGRSGSVRIGVAGAAVLGGMLADRIRVFHEARPLVRIELRETTPLRQRAAILADELDLGYSALPAPPDESRLASVPVSSAAFEVALPAAHPLAGHETLTVEDIAGEELIEYAVGTEPADQYPDILRRAGLPLMQPGAHHRADSTLTVLALVAAGVGIAVAPAWVHRAAVPEVVYRPLTGPGLAVEFHLLYRTTETDPAVSAFLRGATEAGRPAAT